MNLSELRSEAKRVASLATTASTRIQTFGEISGWELVPGQRSDHASGQKYSDALGNDWKDFHYIGGTLVLGTDGYLWEVDRSWGETSERPYWDKLTVKEATAERLVGTDNEPFEKVASALRRLEAISS